MDALTPERWQQIRSVFERALEVPPEARPALLAELCAGDDALRSEIDRLLAADARAHRLLEAPVGEFAPALLDEIARESPDGPGMAGRRLGAYRLLRGVGRGGMGTVYLAERADGQFEQRVAVKLLRRGLDTDDLLQRFLAERQILASLNHPNIARLLDGGATEDGRPYLVMEYVEGRPIDVYCDESRLAVRERLEHFLTVAEALRHAHRNLVVHRDLKPSNILVSRAGEVKLLDFGIAKLLAEGEQGSGTGPYTRAGTLPMTPEYATPEHVKGESVTAASDIYQLGLLLYELLTGRRAHALTGRTPGEIERVICEEEPPRPSTVVTRAVRAPTPNIDGTRSAESLARARRTTPDRLRKRLRGDLDAIVLQALRREPERRYSSVEALLEDVRRHLARRPVRARGESRAYRARKFVRRNRWGVAAVAVVLSLLAGYAVTISVQAGQIRAALAVAELERAKAEEVSGFLMGLFEATRPERARGEEVTAQDLLAQGVERAEELGDAPEVRARMLAVIGKTYHRLGMYDEAQELYERSLALRQEHLGPTDAQIAEGLNDLGVLLKDRADYAAAEPLLRRAIAMRREVLGDEHVDLAVSLDELGRLLDARGDHAGAEPLFREGLAMRRRLLGNEHHETASSLNSVGLVLRVQGDTEGAEPLFREALAIYRTLYGEDHPWVATLKNNLALVLIDRQDLASAEDLLLEALEFDRAALEANHPTVLIRMNHLGTVYREQERYEEADSLIGQAARMGRPVFGDQHPRLASFLLNHGRVFLGRGEAGQAEPILGEALEILQAALPEGDWRIAEAEGWLGQAVAQLGRYDEAEPLVLESFVTLEGRWGAGDPRTRVALERVLAFYDAWGRPDEAERYGSLLARQ